MTLDPICEKHPTEKNLLTLWRIENGKPVTLPNDDGSWKIECASCVMDFILGMRGQEIKEKS